LRSVPPHALIAGFVLAGGGSRRFGSDKAMAIFRDRRLVSYPLGALRSVGLSPTIVAPHAESYREWCRDALTDERPGLGPLGGVWAVLQASRREWALILSVDMPCVEEAHLLPLLSRIARSPDLQAICYADSDGRRHPFPGAYNRSLLGLIEDLVDGCRPIAAGSREDHGSTESRSSTRGGRSMQWLLDRARTALLGSGDLGAEIDLSAALRNVNRPEDLLA
jgi:molybdenum cofactor guanylyltransferase